MDQMNIDICSKCPIYNDGFLQQGIRKTCNGNPRLIPNIGKRKLLFFGEAYGENEDYQNQAFVGAAGKKFDALLAETGLLNFDIRISNVVKCRPIKVENKKYKNRAPTDEEVMACSFYLKEDWDFNPDLTITLGRVPTRALFPTLNPSEIRGKGQKILINYKEFCVLPTYHPAATIYDPSTKPILFKHLSRASEYLKGLDESK